MRGWISRGIEKISSFPTNKKENTVPVFPILELTP
jgi:hypothetical protein